VEGVSETMLPIDTEMALRYKDCHLIVLRGFQDPRGYGPLWTARQVLKALAELPPDVRFNFDGIDILCRAHLLTMGEFDGMLAQVCHLLPNGIKGKLSQCEPFHLDPVRPFVTKNKKIGNYCRVISVRT